nr:unnamed protein product [Fasciola hepatica]
MGGDTLICDARLLSQFDTTMRRTMYACIAWPDDRLYRLVFLDRVIACGFREIDAVNTERSSAQRFAELQSNLA